jgi:hypothetical protein
VWFEKRLVQVGTQQALLTESYGSDEGFSRDVKTLYFEGPHRELGVVRATSNIFFGDDIWDRTEDGPIGRSNRSHREAKQQQAGDDELIAIAASVRPATTSEFAAAARRVENGRICKVAAESGSCALDDSWCAKRERRCVTGPEAWGDWQRSPKHSVYMEFVDGGTVWFALAPAVQSLRITKQAHSGKEQAAGTVPTRLGTNGVRWALVRESTYRVTALDASGRALETVRTDLSGP